MSLNPDRFPKQKKPLIDAINCCITISRFSKSIGVSRQVVDGWLYTSKLAPPAKYCKKIEEVTMGNITREHLRPDLFGEIKNDILSEKDKLAACISILEGVKESLASNTKKGNK